MQHLVSARLSHKQYILLCCIIAQLMLLGCQPLAPTMPTVHDIVGRGDTTATIANDGTLLIEIQSESGIGGAKVQLNNAPINKITLRLYLAGLEQLTLTNERTKLTASVSSVDNVSIIQGITPIDPSAGQTDSSVETPITVADPNWLTLYTPGETQSTSGSFFEIGVPKHYWDQPERVLSITWIDFYR